MSGAPHGFRETNAPSVALPCPTHGLSAHRLVVRPGFTPYRQCEACDPSADVTPQEPTR